MIKKFTNWLSSAIKKDKRREKRYIELEEIDFENYEVLNPKEVEIKEDRVINLSKKYENSVFRICSSRITMEQQNQKQNKSNIYCQ